MEQSNERSAEQVQEGGCGGRRQGEGKIRDEAKERGQGKRREAWGGLPDPSPGLRVPLVDLPRCICLPPLLWPRTAQVPPGAAFSEALHIGWGERPCHLLRLLLPGPRGLTQWLLAPFALRQAVPGTRLAAQALYQGPLVPRLATWPGESG